MEYWFDEEIKTAYGFELPISVRFGDVDGDGFVDLLSVMKSTKDSKTRAVILRNIKDDSLPGGRKFDLFWTSEHLISDNVELASFLDVQENGRLDVIMTTRNATDGYNIIWIRNMLIETSCFLKVLVTTGLCGSGGCPGEKCLMELIKPAFLYATKRQTWMANQ
ncbi:T-cell immunomodulatory protein [Tyrophagus putrescentiae]|nr:T-cell immunomodulatory protein [Tyrophagus putrescentiae]